MSDLEMVKDYFTRSASGFDSLYSEKEMTPFARFINLKFRSDIYERFVLTMNHVNKYKLASILDVGCGSGRYANALAQAGVQRVVGIDCSETMVQLAAKNTRAVADQKTILRYICGDFMDVDPGGPFDLVIAMGFFDYVRNPVPVIAKMKRLSRHTIIASFPSISIYRTPIRKFRYYLKGCPVFFYTPETIRSICCEAGVSSVEIMKIAGSGMDYFVTVFT